jgi:hypothetical protein
LSDHLLRDAVSIVDEENVLAVEQWAAVWLGDAWLAAGLVEREPEKMLHLEVIGRASTRPTPPGLAAVAALRRLAGPDDLSMFNGTLDILKESQPVPWWLDEPAFEPVRAWRAVDVWDSEHVLFVEYGGSFPHTVMAQILLSGGRMVRKLALLTIGVAAEWASLREPGEVPMPAVECPVDEVLAELAEALRATDMLFPKPDDEDFVGLRALAWSRCRAHLPEWPEFEPMADADRDRLLSDFGPAGETVARSLAELFLIYGEGYLVSGPLCWSPETVELFLADWLPRKAVLDAGQVAALPEVLRRWVRFALRRRGVDDEWIGPVVEAVDMFLPEFTEAYDDPAAWGPAKQIAGELAGRKRALNAERLARRIIDG